MKMVVQKRLDSFRYWYNEKRPHAAHGMVPTERVLSVRPRESTWLLQKEGLTPQISVERHRFDDDPMLPVLAIRLRDGPIAA